jgi:kynurenine formamidase
MSKQLAAADEVIGWAKSLSNWGRWGNEDTLGTLNFITDDVRQRAAAEVRSGVSISCAWDVPASSRLGGTVNRFMLSSGDALHEADPSQHVHGVAETLQFQFHGFEMTHIDALSHMFWDAKMYNGRSAQNVTTTSGASELGVETIRSGIVTRGVLLDVAAARGVNWLEPGDGAFPEDLEAAEKAQGTRVEPGDALLLSTGFSAYRRQNTDKVGFDVGWPGFQAACLPWLHERQVAVISTDGNNECIPNGYTDVLRHPIHSIGIVAMGLWLVDNANLESLVDTCRAQNRYTFLYVVTPVPIEGATGGPVNPVAIF